MMSHELQGNPHAFFALQPQEGASRCTGYSAYYKYVNPDVDERIYRFGLPCASNARESLLGPLANDR
jgi:hypothetical protein